MSYATFLLNRRHLTLLRSPCLLAVVLFAATAGAQETVRHAQVGVGTHFGQNWNVEKVMPLIARSGVGWIRDDFSWAAYERQKGVYRVPERAMAWIDAAHAAGLKIDLLFNGSNKLYAPDIYDADAYARAAAMSAKELAGKVQVIEILNEPANFGFSRHYGGVWNGLEKDGSISPWVAKYVELINKSAKAIKAANPGVKVIGLGAVPPVNHRQLAMGVAPEVDGIVDHPYSYRTVPELQPYTDTPSMMKRDGIATADERGTFSSFIRMYRQQSAKYDGPKELWLTEWGWSDFQKAKPGGLYAGFTRSAQAKYILRRLAQSLGLGVDATFIYDFKDDGVSPYEVEHHFGLVDYELNPKPSYSAVQQFTAAMAKYRPHKSFEVNISAVTGEIECYQFADGEGKPLIALWSSERADGDLNPVLAEVQIVTGLTVVKTTARDLLTGKIYAVPFEAENGTIFLRQFTIPDHPVALTFN